MLRSMTPGNAVNSTTATNPGVEAATTMLTADTHAASQEVLRAVSVHHGTMPSTRVPPEMLFEERLRNVTYWTAFGDLV